MDRVAALAREADATPYMVLLAAFGVLLQRYTHSDDFLVATPVLNRTAGAEDVIGYYGNTVALRLRPGAHQTRQREHERHRAREQDRVDGRARSRVQASEPGRQQSIPPSDHRKPGVPREDHIQRTELP